MINSSLQLRQFWFMNWKKKTILTIFVPKSWLNWPKLELHVSKNWFYRVVGILSLDKTVKKKIPKARKPTFRQKKRKEPQQSKYNKQRPPSLIRITFIWIIALLYYSNIFFLNRLRVLYLRRTNRIIWPINSRRNKKSSFYCSKKLRLVLCWINKHHHF